ncbi:TPA: Shedu immune nuclease family protein [Enterobacter roggenkampii]
MPTLDETLIANFKALLDAPAPPGRQKEQVIQDFLEQNTQFIPTPNLLNHGLHFQSIISKFPLGTELTTDYAYITKSSDVWILTLVELESSDKNIFTSDSKKTNTTAEFNAALNQVRSWKNFIDDNKAEVIRRIQPLLKPAGMSQNPVQFNYQLIIGRSVNKNFNDERKKHFRGLISETGINIMTYDQLIDYGNYPKLVLRLTGTQYEFKHMSFAPTQIFAFLGPNTLSLSREQKTSLEESGYEMEKWNNGELLTFNVKFAASSSSRALANGGFF